MPSLQSLKAQREQVLEQIAQLGPMRKGSITSQFFVSTRKDGRQSRRGPYPLYTCKRGRSTHSRRIASQQLPLYQAQIERFRKFELLMAELVQLSEQMADLALTGSEQEGKKNSKRPSRPSKRPRRRA